ncbi:LOW QUALITY PROTEIN: uncharacterized protein EMH_0006110 [Eimeria mitis]|uniref:Uncharacterized protein n=1 Tax=Eimeria mitis TaxID=44415 RepID=U6K009_9EIME|nr:LOW QUALITY PROTEIN: uncharacterized protein EMH_0006110 [Eimeria mitis]CDJ30321.1 hypothetical protein EMH_0006110 [Eimeria mitis]
MADQKAVTTKNSKKTNSETRKSKSRKEISAKRKINNVAEKKGTEVKGTGVMPSNAESTMDWKKELASFFRQMRDEGRVIAKEMKAKSREGMGEGQRNQSESVAEQIFRSKIAATEDGADLRTFLSLTEQEFREMKISEDQWGLLVRKYLTGRAVKQWDYIYRSGIDMTNWSLVRERLCERFRVLPRDSMILKMKENVWKGDYNEYTNAFTDIVITGEEMPEEELAIFYLAGLPEDIGDKLTKRGKREFPTWHEAAKALREKRVRCSDECVAIKEKTRGAGNAGRGRAIGHGRWQSQGGGREEYRQSGRLEWCNAKGYTISQSSDRRGTRCDTLL